MKRQTSRKTSKSIRLPKTWPHEVSAGDVTVKIYRTQSRVRGKTYRTYTVSYFANGNRQRKQFADFTEASREAKRVAEQKCQGALGVAALTADARVALQSALTLLAANEGTQNATISRLIEIVRDYATATADLPKGATLTEAVRFYAQRHPANMARKTVAETVTEFIADRTSAGCSKIHLRDLKIRLENQFAKAFTIPINSVSAPLVQQWIYGLKNQKTKKPATARTKENMLRQVVALFNFARRMKYVTADLALEVSEIPTPRKENSPIGIFTASEIAAILLKADESLVPALAIAAFAGLRLAEVSRLDWRDVRFNERLIAIDPENAKTGRRRLVPICDNLAAWLTPHVKPFGPISPCEVENDDVGNDLGYRMVRTAGRAKVKWKRNGLRHSYISYRVPIIKNVPELAIECGNSPAVIYSSYLALTTEAEAKAYFAVMPPPAPDNVIVAAPQIAAAAVVGN